MFTQTQPSGLNGASGAANETVRPPLLFSILHSEWSLSSPQPYKSDRGGGGLNGGAAGVWEEGREEGGGRWSGEEKKKNRSYGQTVLFKDVTVIGLLRGGRDSGK